jgi:hypothetical protein
LGFITVSGFWPRPIVTQTKVSDIVEDVPRTNLSLSLSLFFSSSLGPRAFTLLLVPSRSLLAGPAILYTATNLQLSFISWMVVPKTCGQRCSPRLDAPWCIRISTGSGSKPSKQNIRLCTSHNSP